MAVPLPTQEHRHVPVADADPALRSREPTASLPTLSTLFRQHRDDVGRWAARLGGPAIDVDDIVQEVFVVAARQLGDFRGDAKVTTWLFRITDHVVSNHRRWRRVRRILTSLSAREEERTPATPFDPAQSLEDRDAARRAFALLDDLSSRDRKMLVLAELEGLPPEEIAAIVGARLETVRVWLHRARKRWEQRVRASVAAAEGEAS
jgi:RNA polymerase sigma-70 factor (ECF subfamily)